MYEYFTILNSLSYYFFYVPLSAFGILKFEYHDICIFLLLLRLYNLS